MAKKINVELFMEMSVVLTGYAKLDDSLVPVFLKNIKDKTALAKLLTEYGKLSQPRTMQKLMPILKRNPRLMAVAKVITQLWYTGAVKISEAENKEYYLTAYAPVSSTAYLEGIAWEVMKAHPQGQCGNGEYGYWSSPPD